MGPTRSNNWRTRIRSLLATFRSKHSGVNPRAILHTGLGIARAHFAAQHSEPGTTGSLPAKSHWYNPLSFSGDDDKLPDAVPGDD